MRYVIKLYNYFKSYQRLFEENSLKIDEKIIDEIFNEFCSSKTLRIYGKDSEKFFDYLINRLHMLLMLNMFDIVIPFEYKGYKATYKYNWDKKLYCGNVIDEVDTNIECETLDDFEEYFKNTIDYVVKMR